MPMHALYTSALCFSRAILCLGIISSYFSARAAVVTLNFSASSPGTLADGTGQGTGFTDRIPGSGSAIATHDPNLTLDTAGGQLIVGSQRADFSQNALGRNLASLDAPTLRLNGIGTQDLLVQARFNNLRVFQRLDQIGIFVGSSVDNLLRGGVAFFESHPTSGDVYAAGFNYSQNGVDGPPTGAGISTILPGQNAIFEIGRVGGLWHFTWENLDDPSLSRSYGGYAIPGLDSQTDLYLGIFNLNGNESPPLNAYLDYFVVRTGPDVPEPSTWLLATISIAAILVAKRRKK